MRTIPLQIKSKTIEIGFRGHTRWGVNNIRTGVRPTVIGDFHLFVNFKAKQRKRKHLAFHPKETRIVFDEFMDCTINEKGCIQVWKCRYGGSILLDVCTPYPVEAFFTDLAEWTFDPEICYPIPEERRREAATIAIQYLQRLQKVLDAHVRYWDTEGRPPVRNLTVEEVLSTYATSSGEIE